MIRARFPSILLVCPSPHVQGGVSAFTQSLTKNINNYKVTPFYVGSNPKTKEMAIAKIMRMLKMLSSLLIYRCTHYSDIVHINPSFNTSSLLRDGLILFTLRLTGCKHILVFFHGWDTAAALRMKHHPMRGLFVWLMNGTACIMVLATEYKQALTQMGIREDRIFVGSTMFDEECIPASRTEQTRNILFMSRFDSRKGIYELLAAFAAIVDEFPDAQLIFAGDGGENAKLRAAAEASGLGNRIRFTGYVSGKDKTALLRDATIFTLPTYYPEGMPVALLEAMAAGLPLLTSKAGGICHIVREPENGVVLKDITVATIADGLRRLLGNKSYCAETGAHNAKYARKYFEAKTVTARIEKIYDEIAQ